MRAAAEPAGVLAQLQAETRDLHTKAERHPIQAALVRGRASVEAYVLYLQQLGHIHAALEDELLARRGEALLSPVDPSRFRATLAAEDVRELGADGLSAPVGPVAAFSRELVDVPTLHLLGMHYVLEGSTNGGRFIARAVRRCLPLEAQSATRYLDPYGDEQGSIWGEYCRALASLPLSEADAALLLGGAEAMFRLIIDTFDAMESASGAARA